MFNHKRREQKLLFQSVCFGAINTQKERKRWARKALPILQEITHETAKISFLKTLLDQNTLFQRILQSVPEWSHEAEASALELTRLSQLFEPTFASTPDHTLLLEEALPYTQNSQSFYEIKHLCT